jgi:phosphoglycolate phosphatase-like HAD superfamily hydrolase
MLRELARAPFTKGPFAALRIAKILRSFRLMREDLRELGHAGAALVELQFSRPAEELGVDAQQVESTVDEWMFRKPLRHLAAAAWPGLRTALVALNDAGLRLGVYSDYPPDAKLKALGVDDLFEVTLGATDAAVNAFKPSPIGFLAGADALDAAPADVVYVGDRHDVDGQGAAAAGMRCVILETGMSHVGAGDVSAPAQANHQCRSVHEFSEVPDAVGIL